MRRVLFPTADLPIIIVLQFLSPLSSPQLIIIKILTIQKYYNTTCFPFLSDFCYLSNHFVFSLKVFAHNNKDNFMLRQITSQEEVLRIILIGLPYSGIEDVAYLLRTIYACEILQLDLQNKPQEMAAHKYARQICFKKFRELPKAVVVMKEVEPKVFTQLRKRNYVNIVCIEAPFRTRYHRFLKAQSLQDNHESVNCFMILDEKFQHKRFQESLEFVRVRVSHRSTIEQLKNEIVSKEKDIIRYFRPTWDQYFMKIADIARRRSNCMKTSVGAVIVNNENRVVSTGYNGTPKGLPSCYKLGCERCNNNQGKQLDQCLCLHAEQSALIEVGMGKTAGCRLYTTYFPCFSCAKIIKQAGIKKIYYIDQYEKQDSGKPFIEEYFSPQDVVKIPVDNLYY